MTEKERRIRLADSPCKKKARKRYNNYNHSGIREKIYIAFESRCALCGWQIDPIFSYSGGCDIHHIIPVSENGTDTFDNLICLCPCCHRTAHILDSDALRLKLQSKTKSETDYFDVQMREGMKSADVIDLILERKL